MKPATVAHGPAGDADDRWTLRAADRALLGNKSGATRLGFAVLLKLFAAEGRFPRRAEDVPIIAVVAVARQVGVPAAAWAGYEWRGRTIEGSVSARANASDQLQSARL